MITVVIPAYNEENAIGQTVADARKLIEEAGYQEPEIIVIDDGSSDNTGKLAEEGGAKVIRNLCNSGYGRSLKEGILAASNDTIVITDADGTYPLEVIPALIKEYEVGYSMVVGQRRGARYHESLIKRPLRRILRFIVEFTTGKKIPDVNSGLRVFSKEEILPYFNQLCNTFSFTTSVTLAYMMDGKHLCYIPIDYHARIGRTKVKLLRDGIRTMQYIVQAVLYYNPIKLFILIAFFTALVSALCFILALTFQTMPFMSLGIVTMMVAILVFSLGLIADQLRQILLRS